MLEILSRFGMRLLKEKQNWRSMTFDQNIKKHKISLCFMRTPPPVEYLQFLFESSRLTSILNWLKTLGAILTQPARMSYRLYILACIVAQSNLASFLWGGEDKKNSPLNPLSITVYCLHATLHTLEQNNQTPGASSTWTQPVSLHVETRNCRCWLIHQRTQSAGVSKQRNN